MEKYLLKKGYEQLDRFMARKDMHCHYKSNERLGDDVYIELGYGKSDNEIKELGRRAQISFTNEDGTLNEKKAFSYMTQLSVQLYPNGWSTGIYIDAEGSYEYENIIKKISDEDYRKKFVELLYDVLREGYLLYIDADDELMFSSPDDFVEKLMEEYESKRTFYTRIVKVEPTDVKNSRKDDVIKAVLGEFDKLYRLYDFMSWNTINNNYIF